jgi:hypothetical protein
MNLNLHGKFDVVGCENLPVSWDNKDGTVVTVFQKRAFATNGAYHNQLE